MGEIIIRHEAHVDAFNYAGNRIGKTAPLPGKKQEQTPAVEEVSEKIDAEEISELLSAVRSAAQVDASLQVAALANQAPGQVAALLE